MICQALPEVRILTAYVNALTESLHELGDAAGHARNAVMELFTGVLTHRVVADEPQLARHRSRRRRNSRKNACSTAISTRATWRRR